MTASFKEDAAAAIELLRRHAGFAAIDDEYLGTLVAQSPIETLHNGAIAFAQGEPGDFAYLVLSGELAVEVETQWGRVRVAVMKSGDLVGEIAAFATLPRTASVIALGAVKVLRLEQGAIRMLVADHPEAAIAIIGDLGRKLHNLNTSTATLVQAASALAEGDFRPAMLEAMEGQADRFGHFAGVFDAMAREITQQRALLQEMRTAAAIQQSFLPKGLDLGGHAGRCDLFATMLPAKQVGGDFYDYFMIDAGRLGFAVGDVSGKGVPAAIFMSLSRTVLKTVASEGGAPGDVLTRMNRLLLAEGGESMFVTVVYGSLDLASLRLDYSVAGHDGAYLRSGRGKLEQLPSLGPAVALLDGADFPTRSRTLAPGDLVFIATDGVTEAFNGKGDMFGGKRLEEMLGELDPPSAEAAVRAVTGAVDAFAAGTPQSDDITCLAIGVP